jgi:hypothetical protein
MNDDAENVKAFLRGLSPAARKLVAALRAAVRRAAPHAAESVVWACLSYHRPRVGGRVRGAVCQIVVRGGRVRLDFIHGVRLADPAQMLEGNRVSKRFVPIETLADVRRPEIAALIREAAALRPAVWAGPKSDAGGGGRVRGSTGRGGRGRTRTGWKPVPQ